MALLKQSTAYTRTFLMVDSADHVTGKTGLTVTVTLSKAGGSFAAAGGTVTEISSGWYKIAFTTTDTNTLGELAVHCTASGADPTDFNDQVVAFDTQSATNLGLSNLDTTVSSRMATFSLPTNFGSLSIDGSGRIDLGKWLGTAPLALSSQYVQSTATVSGPVTVGTNNDKTGYTLSVAGVQAVWDILTASLTTVGSVGKQLATNCDAQSSAIKAKTDTLPNGIPKNTDLNNFMFVMVSSANHVTPATGLTVSAQRSLDGAAFADCVNPVTEVGAGVYQTNLAAADLNGDVVALKFSASGADTSIITIKTLG